MERIITILSAGLAALVLGTVVMNQLHDPYETRRLELATRLADIGAEGDDGDEFEWQFDEWNNMIIEKTSAWQELIPPPPPPPQRPDLAQMLSGVKPTRAQVGDKVRFSTPNNPRGDFLGVGETINGVTIKSIDRKQVVFSYYWREKDEELTYTLQRE